MLLAIAWACAPGAAAAVEGPEDVRVRAVLDDGRVALGPEGGPEWRARLLGLILDEPPPFDALGRLLNAAPVAVRLEPGHAVDPSGTPLVELRRGGASLNEEALRQGLGRADPQAPPRRAAAFLEAERQAREAGRGRWAPPPPPALAIAEEPVVRPASTSPKGPEVGASPGPPPVVADPAPTPAVEGRILAIARSWWEVVARVDTTADGWPLTIAGRLAFAGLGAWVARQRRRRRLEGLALGGLFGPLGVLVEALVPAGPMAVPASESDGLAFGGPTTPPSHASVLWSGTDEADLDDSWLRDDDDAPASDASGSSSGVEAGAAAAGRLLRRDPFG